MPSDIYKNEEEKNPLKARLPNPSASQIFSLPIKIQPFELCQLTDLE